MRHFNTRSLPKNMSLLDDMLYSPDKKSDILALKETKLNPNSTTNIDLPNYNEDRTGIFSWCMISWFYFPWNVNLGNYSSWLMTWRFCVTCEEPELLADIRDFTTLFYVIFRRKSSEWLESIIESHLGMRFAIWSLDLAIRDLTFFKHCF